MLRTIYGFDDLGRKVPTGSYDDGSKAVGGIIFYIDSNSDETVEFYDAQGNVISNVAVGDTPSYYKVTSAGVSGKEKFYIFDNTLYNNKYWGYKDIDIGNTGKLIGDGKLNSYTVLSITDTSQYASGSVWEWITEQNNNKLNSCNDWYIGSENEIEALRIFSNQQGNSLLDSLGNPVSSWFGTSNLGKSIWSSSTFPGYPSSIRHWFKNNQSWAGNSRSVDYSVYAIRSF